MTFRKRLVVIASWRWMSSVAVMAVACLPMAAAVLIIPSEIGAHRTHPADGSLADGREDDAPPAAIAPATREHGTDVPSATLATLPGTNAASAPQAKPLEAQRIR